MFLAFAWAGVARGGEIHFDASMGYLEKVKALLNADSDLVKAKDDQGNTPLDSAAYFGHKEVAELLLAKGADINAKNKYGETPLFTAVRHGKKEVVELLLAKGAEVNAKGYVDYTPLHEAAKTGHKEVAELLLAKGADINAKNEYGHTPLYTAVEHGKKEVVELLLAKGADINAKLNHSPKTLLHFAVENGQKVIIELLLAKGADINANPESGGPPLFYAKNKEVAELLLANGADINVTDRLHKYTLLHYAHHKDVVALALARGLDVNAAGKDGSTPLFFAKNKEVAALLLANGAAVNAKDEIGNTPLHYTASYSKREVVELLLARGADVNAKNKDGLTPIQRAEKSNQKDIVELLRQPAMKAGRGALDDGLVAAGQQQWTVAIRHFLIAQAATPTAPEVLFNLGLAESKVPGRELRAMAWFQAYLLAAPAAANAAAVRKEIANLKVRVEGTLEKLIGQAKQLTGQISNIPLPDAYKEIALTQARIGDIAGAKETVNTRCLTATSASSNALKEIAEVQAEAEEFSGALATASEIMRLPLSGDFTQEYLEKQADSAYGKICEYQAKSGNITGAESTLKRIKNNKIDKINCLKNIATARVMAGQTKEGYANLAEAVQLVSKSMSEAAWGQTFSELAILQADLGDVDGAKKTELLISNGKISMDAYFKNRARKAIAGAAGLPHEAGEVIPRTRDLDHFSSARKPTKQYVTVQSFLELFKKMNGELFTDPQGALQTIAAQPQSRDIINGMLKAIEQLGDCFNNVKRLSP